MLVLALGYTVQQASTALGLLLKARIVSTFGLTCTYSHENKIQSEPKAMQNHAYCRP